ncbi:HD domain-containing protein [Methanogenium marinum]|uniref:HD domain-containing protein n=1 Tax=Methanogenium marinum TaxID=348610 RepID=A0A9Q4PY82_9EURY|nr:HD domain-containing protein [Methanogenium marinum]MDE4907407.1 HD domain-containing protein [Methanogenium marinum]
MEKREFETIRAYVETFFRQSGVHDLDHVLRVTRLSREIGEDEGADMRVLIPAALFHDVARPIEDETGIPHQEEGARIAEKYLREVGYDAERIPAIVHAIRTHRFSTGPEPETLEAKILSDADKLDAMGAVGIARTFMRAGEHGDSIEGAVGHIHEKLLKLQGLMYTDGAREIAEGRHDLLQRFVESLEDEIGSGDLTSPAEPPVQSGNTSSHRT